MAKELLIGIDLVGRLSYASLEVSRDVLSFRRASMNAGSGRSSAPETRGRGRSHVPYGRSQRRRSGRTRSDQTYD